MGEVFEPGRGIDVGVEGMFSSGVRCERRTTNVLGNHHWHDPY
ncbi:hypothetical protein OH492_08300 [Vibrio chagasii]|nr:hypothetical protein [Vibrio chagasii]